MHLGFSISVDTLDEFVRHWSALYQYESEFKYSKNIGKPLTNQSRLELFEWKNGSVISRAKLKSIQTHYPLIFEGDIRERYLFPGKGGGAIWNIFYTHCLSPKVWPIFDQHVYRAMRYIQNGVILEIPKSEEEKFRVYRDEYIAFHASLGTFHDRKLDKALFIFGKFLKTAKKYT